MNDDSPFLNVSEGRLLLAILKRSEAYTDAVSDRLSEAAKHVDEALSAVSDLSIALGRMSAAVAEQLEVATGSAAKALDVSPDDAARLSALMDDVLEGVDFYEAGDDDDGPDA